MKTVFLKKGREKSILHRNHWIFSGAIARKDDIEDGHIIAVCDAHGNHLGYGYYNSRSQIAVRMLSFGTVNVDKAFLASLVQSAYRKRKGNPLLQHTDAYRIIFSEGDFFPGLIVDYYNGHIVFQILTLGIEMLRDTLIELLAEILNPISVYERSDHSARKIEGLTAQKGQVLGSTPDQVLVHENGMAFHVDVKAGQKTGFFLDQRDNRQLIKDISQDKHVLNLFSYTGGFDVAAFLGGAKAVVSIDSSESALILAEKNLTLNHISESSVFIRRDVFHYLRNESIQSNLVIIDPPALAKHRGSVKSACRGYKELNLQTMKKCPKETLILTCSCSRFINMDLFQKVVFSAAADSGRDVCILKKARHPVDHPINIFHSESEYLKALLLFVQ